MLLWQTLGWLAWWLKTRTRTNWERCKVWRNQTGGRDTRLWGTPTGWLQKWFMVSPAVSLSFFWGVFFIKQWARTLHIPFFILTCFILTWTANNTSYIKKLYLYLIFYLIVQKYQDLSRPFDLLLLFLTSHLMPQCLFWLFLPVGKSYDERVDIFSFGIMLCEVSNLG